MANSLTDRALPGTGADAGAISAQGPEVDKPALETPPSAPSSPSGMGGPLPSPKDIKDAIHNQSFIDSRLRGLLEEGGPVARKDVIQVATEIVAERAMSAQAIAGYLADLPEDPQDVREWVQRHANSAEQSLQQLMIALHGSEAPQKMMSAPAAGGQMNGGPAPPTTSGAPNTPMLQ